MFDILMESSINLAVFTLHNKILLWRGNISTSFALLEFCKFNPNFPLNFGVIVFYMLPISLTSFLPLCCMIKHLLNSFFTSCQIILFSKFLIACVLHPLSLIPEPNFLQGHGSVFFLAVLLMLMDTRSLTLTLILFLFLGMSFFMKMFSHLF